MVAREAVDIINDAVEKVDIKRSGYVSMRQAGLENSQESLESSADNTVEKSGINWKNAKIPKESQITKQAKIEIQELL